MTVQNINCTGSLTELDTDFSSKHPPSCPALTVHNISASYGGGQRIIEHISFDIMRGERVGVLGPNGAGKSTLFKTLVGLIPHQTGNISIHGEDCRTSHKLIGYVPQTEEIDWQFPATVRDVVMMGRVRQIGWFRLPTPKHWRAVDAALERVGMFQFRNHQIGELSGGQRRRVFIARALAQETDVLLLDEPFSGVDIAAESEIMRVLNLLRDQMVTVILATHDLSTAQEQFDRLLLLKHNVIAFGSPQAVLKTDLLKAAYGRRVGVFQDGSRTVVVADTK